MLLWIWQQMVGICLISLPEDKQVKLYDKIENEAFKENKVRYINEIERVYEMCIKIGGKTTIFLTGEITTMHIFQYLI